ncbi:MAG: helix-turn-helix transcriptional regulator [Acidobacteriota bacterium]
MTWTFLNILIVIVAFQLLFFSVFLATRRSEFRVRYRLLALFLFSMALPLLSFILYRADLSIYLSYPYLFWFGNSFGLLWGPSLYLYVRSLVDRDFGFKKLDALHLIPLALYWLYKLLYFHVHGAHVKLELLLVGKVLDSTDLLVAGIALHVIVLAYTAASWRALAVYRRGLRDAYSSIEKIDLSWLRFVLVGFGLVWIAALGNSLVSFVRGYPALLFCTANVLYVFCASNVILFKGLRQNEAFSGLEQRTKYAQSTLSRADSEKHLERLRTLMEEEELYLTPSLSVDQLAQKLHIQPRHLSQTINDCAGQSFIDFVNRYRIEEAKRLLKDPEHKRTILEVAYQSGFNSKATFNSAFRKSAGMTPSRFRKAREGILGSDSARGRTES